MNVSSRETASLTDTRIWKGQGLRFALARLAEQVALAEADIVVEQFDQLRLSFDFVDDHGDALINQIFLQIEHLIASPIGVGKRD